MSEAPQKTGVWCLTLVCCGRHDGFQVQATEPEAKQFRRDYLDVGTGYHAHDRQAILTRLDTPVRVGFHEESEQLTKIGGRDE